jgi:hypothetical protein
MSNEFEWRYGQAVKLGKIELQIDEEGFVFCPEFWAIWHLEECLEVGMALMEIIDAINDIDLSSVPKQDPIF